MNREGIGQESLYLSPHDPLLPLFTYQQYLHVFLPSHSSPPSLLPHCPLTLLPSSFPRFPSPLSSLSIPPHNYFHSKLQPRCIRLNKTTVAVFKWTVRQINNLPTHAMWLQALNNTCIMLIYHLKIHEMNKSTHYGITLLVQHSFGLDTQPNFFLQI